VQFLYFWKDSTTWQYETVIGKMRWHTTGAFYYPSVACSDITGSTWACACRKYNDDTGASYEDENTNGALISVVGIQLNTWVWFRKYSNTTHHILKVWNDTVNEPVANSGTHAEAGRVGSFGFHVGNPTNTIVDYDEWQVWNSGYVPKMFVTSSTITLGHIQIPYAPPSLIKSSLVICFETKPICVKLDDYTIYYFDNVNTQGNMHVSLSLPVSYPYIFAHTNNTMNVGSAGIWYNISFDEEESTPKSKIDHTYNDNTNDTFTIIENGYYDISYSMSFSDASASPSGHIVMRVVKNGVEISGTLLEEDSTKQYSDFTISNGAFVYLIIGDKIKFQFTSDDTDVSLTSHRTYGDHHDTAILKIIRIA